MIVTPRPVVRLPFLRIITATPFPVAGEHHRVGLLYSHSARRPIPRCRRQPRAHFLTRRCRRDEKTRCHCCTTTTDCINCTKHTRVRAHAHNYDTCVRMKQQIQYLDRVDDVGQWLQTFTKILGLIENTRIPSKI